jgi:hypothetical protein
MLAKEVVGDDDGERAEFLYSETATSFWLSPGTFHGTMCRIEIPVSGGPALTGIGEIGVGLRSVICHHQGAGSWEHVASPLVADLHAITVEQARGQGGRYRSRRERVADSAQVRSALSVTSSTDEHERYWSVASSELPRLLGLSNGRDVDAMVWAEVGRMDPALGTEIRLDSYEEAFLAYADTESAAHALVELIASLGAPPGRP